MGFDWAQARSLGQGVAILSLSLFLLSGQLTLLLSGNLILASKGLNPVNAGLLLALPVLISVLPSKSKSVSSSRTLLLINQVILLLAAGLLALPSCCGQYKWIGRYVITASSMLAFGYSFKSDLDYSQIAGRLVSDSSLGTLFAMLMSVKAFAFFVFSIGAGLVMQMAGVEYVPLLTLGAGAINLALLAWLRSSSRAVALRIDGLQEQQRWSQIGEPVPQTIDT